MVDRALAELSPTFNQMYAQVGRPSIPPEHLLKGCLLIALYSIRSERQFCQRLQYDLLFKWFLDLNIMDPAFDPSTFAKNKTQLLEHQVSRQFFSGVLAEARRRSLLSEDHFTVDGTLLEAWASLKSFRPRSGGGPPSSGGGRNPEVNFRGEKRCNETHVSTTDPEAQLARKGLGKEAKLSFGGHVLMENRNGLAVDVTITQATGTAEWEAAGPGYVGTAAWSAPGDGRSGQALRYRRLCGGMPRDARHPPRSPEHLWAPQCHQWTDYPTPRICGEPAGAEAGGGNLWLGQNSGRRPEGTLHWSNPQPAVGGVDGGGLQPGTDGEAGIGQLSDSWGGVCPVTGLPGFPRHEAPVTGAR